jgi:glycosyltransferase involved in cell wall biosynthesis
MINTSLITGQPKTSPLLSIVTVVRNGEDSIESTIASVAAQKTECVEYIIIDGASTDRTLGIIDKLSGHIDHWISESDCGIYEAMNKGIRAASGRFIGLLNSGDYYEENALRLVIDEIRNLTDPLVVIAGGVTTIDAQGQSIATNLVDTDSLANKYRFMPLSHPAMFVAKSVYTDIAMYREDMRISSDYELLLKILEYGVQIRFIPAVLTKMQAGGISESPKTIFTRIGENYVIRRKYTSRAYCAGMLARELMSFLYRLLRDSSPIRTLLTRFGG